MRDFLAELESYEGFPSRAWVVCVTSNRAWAIEIKLKKTNKQAPIGPKRQKKTKEKEINFNKRQKHAECNIQIKIK